MIISFSVPKYHRPFHSINIPCMLARALIIRPAEDKFIVLHYATAIEQYVLVLPRKIVAEKKIVRRGSETVNISARSWCVPAATSIATVANL